MRLVTKRVSELTPAEYKQCASLNMREGGAMQRMLSSQRAQRRGTVHMCTENGMLLGWVLEFMLGTEPTAYFYVRRTHRRRGIGTKLCSKIPADTTVYPWDGASTAFFNTTKFMRDNA